MFVWFWILGGVLWVVFDRVVVCLVLSFCCCMWFGFEWFDLAVKGIQVKRGG